MVRMWSSNVRASFLPTLPLAPRDDPDLGTQRRGKRSDRAKLRVHLRSEQPAHRRIVPTDGSGQVSLAHAGVHSESVESSHDIVDLVEFAACAVLLEPELWVKPPFGRMLAVKAGIEHGYPTGRRDLYATDTVT